MPYLAGSDQHSSYLDLAWIACRPPSFGWNSAIDLAGLPVANRTAGRLACRRLVSARPVDCPASNPDLSARFVCSDRRRFFAILVLIRAGLLLLMTLMIFSALILILFIFIFLLIFQPILDRLAIGLVHRSSAASV